VSIPPPHSSITRLKQPHRGIHLAAAIPAARAFNSDIAIAREESLRF
jgi:hypothetical protein